MDDKTKHFKHYGWKVNEDNLKTLPPSAPPVAKDLARWLTLEGRRSSLQEWLNCVQDDGKIHGKFWNIGAWTQRMSHSSPNQANIPSILGKDPETPVEDIKAKYDHQLRELFEADDESWLVGCDADGIQLRILAHYLESSAYRDAILSGDKAKGTDIHSLNQKALGPICKSRDDAKTFIYAWLLGAGIPKVASILGCSVGDARGAVDSFLKAIPELGDLKRRFIPKAAAKGGFFGLDGRWVSCTSEHLMLAGMLQSGEAIVMKHAMVLWHHNLTERAFNFKAVNFVHDEWQTVVYGTEHQAKAVGREQAKAIRLTGEKLDVFCPLSGAFSIGKNWKETH